jgi:hypothetical protein
VTRPRRHKRVPPFPVPIRAVTIQTAGQPRAFPSRTARLTHPRMDNPSTCRQMRRSCPTETPRPMSAQNPLLLRRIRIHRSRGPRWPTSHPPPTRTVLRWQAQRLPVVSALLQSLHRPRHSQRRQTRHRPRRTLPQPNRRPRSDPRGPSRSIQTIRLLPTRASLQPRLRQRPRRSRP